MKGMSAKKNSKSSSVWWTEVNKSQVTLAFARSETGNEFSAGILDLRFLANQKALRIILLYPFTIRVPAIVSHSFLVIKQLASSKVCEET